MTPEEKRRELFRKQLAARQASAAVNSGEVGPTKANASKALTDQAMAAYSAGDDAEGKRLLVEATRAAQDAGMMPEGIVADPQTGGTLDLRADPTIPEGQAASAGFGLMQGLGYNFGDELIGGMAAATGQDPRFYTERARETQRRAQENDPLTYGAANIGGAVASSLTAGKALGLGPALTGTTGQRAVAGALLGAGEGVASGFGGGEGLNDRLTGAAAYGAGGLALGAAAPYVLKGAGQVWDKVVSGPIASMRSAPSAVRASDAVNTALKRSGMTADEVDDLLRQAEMEGQGVFTLADALGNSGQRMLAGVARQPGDARQGIVDTLMRRQEGQGGRVAGFLVDQLDAPDTALQRSATLTAARDATADTAYSAARGNAAPVDVRGALGVIDARLGPMQGMGVADDGIAATLSRYRNRLAAPNPQAPNTSVELSDFDRVLMLKQEIGDDIGAAVRAGRNNEARELGKVKDALDAALEDASKGYRAANDGFAKATRAIEAVDAGKASASSRMRPQDVADQYTRLGSVSPEATDAFRAGRADTEIARIDAAAPGVNKVRSLLSDKSLADLGLMANDPATLNRQLGREDTMFRTTQAATGGSMTADNLADAADIEKFNYGLLANLLTGNWKTAAAQAGPTILNSLQGRNTATRDLIAKMLLDKNIRGAIAPALAAEAKAGPRRAIVEALVRGLPRPTN